MGDSRDAMKVRRALEARRLELPFLETDLPLNLDLSRRDILKIAGYGSLAAFIAACGGSPPTTGGSTTGGTLSIGSYQSDPARRPAWQDIVDAFTAANGGTKVTVNTVSHNTFQDTINSYLQGTPEDVFTWFSGHRMRFFADKGLCRPDRRRLGHGEVQLHRRVRHRGQGQRRPRLRRADRLLPVGGLLPQGRLRGQGLHGPDQLGRLQGALRQDEDGRPDPDRHRRQKDGWPAQGTFDIINLRLNGYDFHTEPVDRQAEVDRPQGHRGLQEVGGDHPVLLAGAERDDLAAGGGHARCASRPACTCSACSCRTSSRRSGSQADVDQLDFFPFPDLGTSFDAEKALDAPIDVCMMSKKSPTLSKDRGQAAAFLEFMAKGSTQGLFFKQAPGFIPTANDADTSTYSAAAEEGAADRQRGQARSPSSSTATRGRTSPARTACRAS